MMIWLPWLLGFLYLLLSFTVGWRIGFVILWDNQRHDLPLHYTSAKRDDAAFWGAVWGLGWPLLLVSFGFWKLFGSWILGLTPQEKRERREIEAKEELRELKRKAKEMGLSL